MAEIILTDVTKRWGQFYGVDRLNLRIEDNAFVTLLGPSGCGKTTTLRMIAGLETPTSGRIEIGGNAVYDSGRGINVPANRRRVGFLFQNYALWPNMTVYQNIAFGLQNVREEMPLYDFDMQNARRLQEFLRKDGADLRRQAQGASGREARAALRARLAEQYALSVYAAGELLDLSQDAAKGERLLSQRLDSLEKAHRAAGETVDAQYAIHQDGKPKTAVRKLTREEVDRTVRRVSRIVKIGMFLDRYPSELSGGQQQRVAIARTLAPGPGVLFMDEPLSNLDAKLRLEMRSELQRLHLETGSTFIYVTHDQLEAMTLSTRVCLLDNGVLQQYDQPLTLYNQPANLFAADFVGNPSVNFIRARGGQADDGTLRLHILDGMEAAFTPGEPLRLEEAVQAARALPGGGSADKSNADKPFSPAIPRVGEAEQAGAQAVDDPEALVLGIRPEFVQIDPLGEAEGEIFSAMPTGMETTVRLRVRDYLLTGVIFGGVTYRLGESVRFRLAGSGVMLFDSRSGRLLARGALRILDGNARGGNPAQ